MARSVEADLQGSPSGGNTGQRAAKAIIVIEQRRHTVQCLQMLLNHLLVRSICIPLPVTNGSCSTHRVTNRRLRYDRNRRGVRRSPPHRHADVNAIGWLKVVIVHESLHVVPIVIPMLVRTGIITQLKIAADINVLNPA